MKRSAVVLVAMLLMGASRCVCDGSSGNVAYPQFGRAYQLLPDGGVRDLSECFPDGGPILVPIWGDGGMGVLAPSSPRAR